MSLDRSVRPLARCLQCSRHNRVTSRSISATTRRAQEDTTPQTPSADPPPPPPLAETEAAPRQKRINPETVSNPKRERWLIRRVNPNQYPIGSRRRRAALASSARIPFHELPYQCFQEARKVLKEDRAEKVAEIEELRAKIAKWKATEAPPERQAKKELQIQSWNRHIERLKIFGDINDPLVKKNFEDGFGDMNKPIYRHLANLKWRSHKREVLMQRVTQMNVVPDVLPAIDPTVSTRLSFGKSKVQHGDHVLAATSEHPPQLHIQLYEKGPKLVTIAVVTPDVPNVKKDGFDYRCHFLAANVLITPTRPNVDLAALETPNVIHEWTPPYSQKGAPYQRLAVFILEQPSSIPTSGNEGEKMAAGGTSREADHSATTPSTNTGSHLATNDPTEPAPERLDISAIKRDPRYSTRENFILRSFATKYRLKPIGVDLFRTLWDETTADVMRRNGIIGHDVEFKRKRVDPLPYKRLKSERYR